MPTCSCFSGWGGEYLVVDVLEEEDEDGVEVEQGRGGAQGQLLEGVVQKGAPSAGAEQPDEGQLKD